MGYILTTNNLTKTYGKKDAAKDVNIHVREGEIYGLIGRNGAGKTTVMRMISGLSNPTSGSFSFNSDSRIGVGVLIESPGIYPHFSAAENIRLKCIAMNCYSKEYVDDLLLTVGLENAGKKEAGSFSLGMRQRLGIALALVGDPKMIVLDEPINGLDPQGIVEVRETLERLKEKKGITIMVSSHILDELSKLADSFGIIHEGRLVDEFTTDELTDRCGQYVTVRTTDNHKSVALINRSDELFEGVKTLPASIDKNGDVHVNDAIHKTVEIAKLLVENNVGVQEIFINKTTLEDYYLSVTGGQHNG